MNPAVTIAAGIVVWLVTAFLKREHWPSDVNLLLTMAVAAVAGLATVVGQDVWSATPLSWSHGIEYATADFAVATLIYGVLTVRVPGLRQAAQGIARLTSSPTALSAAASALPSVASPSPSPSSTPSPSPSPSPFPFPSPSPSTAPTPTAPRRNPRTDPPAMAMAASAPAPASASSSTRAPASASPAAASARVSASSRSTRRPPQPSSISTPSLSSALSALSALVASAPGPIAADSGLRTQLSPVISGPIPGTRRSERTIRGRALGQFPPLQPGS